MKQYDQLLIEKIKKEKSEKNRLQLESNRAQLPRYDSLAIALDDYYFLNQLQAYCGFLCYKQMVHNNLIAYDHQAFRLIPFIVELLEKEVTHNPILNIYNQIRILFESIDSPSLEDDKRFEKCYEAINTEYNSETKELCIEALSFLSNYSIRMLNQKKSVYLNWAFIINSDIFTKQYKEGSRPIKKLPVAFFKNMVILAALMTDKKLLYWEKGLENNERLYFEDGIEWAKFFIETNKRRLTKPNGSKYLSFCKAYLAFQEKDFHTAYNILNNPSRLRGMLINMDIKKLHLQILFELQLKHPEILEKDDIDIAQYSESLRKLIADDKKRKKELNYQADHYADFEKLFRRMNQLFLKYKQPFATKDKQYATDINNFSEKINNCNRQFKNWFFEKLQEIKQTH